MSWFGWLTKAQLEVSFLDRLVMIAEIAVLVFCIGFPIALFEVRKDKKRRARR